MESRQAYAQAYADFLESRIQNESDAYSTEVSDTDSTSLQHSQHITCESLCYQSQQQETSDGETSGAGMSSAGTSSGEALWRSRRADKIRTRLQQETPEQKALRLSKKKESDRLYKQNKRQQETPEETALRRAQRAEYVRLRRHELLKHETPEERAVRRFKIAEKQRLRRQQLLQQETPEEAAIRISRRNEYYREKMRRRRLEMKTKKKSKNDCNEIQDKFNPEGPSSSTEELPQNSEDEIPLEKIKVVNNVIFTKLLPVVTGTSATEELFQNNEDEIPLEKIKVENNDIFVEPLPILNIT